MPKTATLDTPARLARSPLLSVKDVAARLGVNHQTVRKLVEAGALRSIRVGRAVRFRDTWIEEYIDRRR